MPVTGTTEERLLGFDARERWLDGATWWSAERRKRYLLRPVPKPLSVDVLVWPSVFGDGLPPGERARLGLDEARLPGWRGANAGLWDDLDRMRSHLATLEYSSGEPFRVIAVTWSSRDGFRRSAAGGPYLEPTNPGTPGAHGRSLGHDVADGSLLSGLSNCGYSEAERNVQSNRWGPHLNEHHLFADVDQAFAFRAACDLRVPEHAPFYVLRIWSIDE